MQITHLFGDTKVKRVIGGAGLKPHSQIYPKLPTVYVMHEMHAFIQKMTEETNKQQQNTIGSLKLYNM